MIKKSLDQGCHGINKLRVAMKLFTSIIFDIYLTTFNLTGYNSNCFKENIFFTSVIESCYRNGNRGENCKWVYSLRLCLNEFLERLALL
jgi:hypothetical protein